MKLHLQGTRDGFISSSKRLTIKEKHKTQTEPTVRKAQKSTKELMFLKKVSNTVPFLELPSNLLQRSHVLPLGRILDKVLETETPTSLQSFCSSTSTCFILQHPAFLFSEVQLGS